MVRIVYDGTESPVTSGTQTLYVEEAIEQFRKQLVKGDHVKHTPTQCSTCRPFTAMIAANHVSNSSVYTNMQQSASFFSSLRAAV